jgi:hypothetical protein
MRELLGKEKGEVMKPTEHHWILNSLTDAVKDMNTMYIKKRLESDGINFSLEKIRKLIFDLVADGYVCVDDAEADLWADPRELTEAESLAADTPYAMTDKGWQMWNAVQTEYYNNRSLEQIEKDNERKRMKLAELKKKKGVK